VNTSQVLTMIYTEIDLIQMHVEALFVHDADGKLLHINEPEPTNPPPRFFLSRTHTGTLWRIRYDLPADLNARLEQFAANEPPITRFDEPPRYAAQYTDLLNQHSAVNTTEAGLAYYLPESDTPHDSVLITPENVTLLAAHFDWLLTTLADYEPVAAAVVDGKAVAVCFCSRITAKVAEAGVFTEAAYRGRGAATHAVRGWAKAVRSTGRLPLYGTSSTNSASQAVARSLGAVQYAVDFSIT
jgi:RimJ/RimL family protein N-acetyltransferase